MKTVLYGVHEHCTLTSSVHRRQWRAIERYDTRETRHSAGGGKGTEPLDARAANRAAAAVAQGCGVALDGSDAPRRADAIPLSR